MKSDAAVRALADELAEGFMQHKYGCLKDAKAQGQPENYWFFRHEMAYEAYHDLLSRVFAPKETTK